MPYCWESDNLLLFHHLPSKGQKGNDGQMPEGHHYAIKGKTMTTHERDWR